MVAQRARSSTGFSVYVTKPGWKREQFRFTEATTVREVLAKWTAMHDDPTGWQAKISYEASSENAEIVHDSDQEISETCYLFLLPKVVGE